MTTDRDAELSALLDGALPAREESALRDEITRLPELAARLEELARVDAVLRALPARPVPGDLRARLQTKLDAERSDRPLLSARRDAAPRRPLGRRAWLAGFGAAAAAAAAALFVMIGGPRDPNLEPERELASKAPALVAPNGIEQPRDTVLAEARPEPSTGAIPLEPAGIESVGSSEPIAAVSPQPAPLPELAPGPLVDAAPEQTPSEPTQLAATESATISSDDEGTADESAAALSLAPEEQDAPPEQLALAPAAVPLYVELTDDEADALGKLELHDAGIVGVLDLLGELDGLEAEAS